MGAQASAAAYGEPEAAAAETAGDTPARHQRSAMRRDVCLACTSTRPEVGNERRLQLASCSTAFAKRAILGQSRGSAKAYAHTYRARQTNGRQYQARLALVFVLAPLITYAFNSKLCLSCQASRSCATLFLRMCSPAKLARSDRFQRSAVDSHPSV
eukprot:363042-Chlamydomonas_euryale.AAC.2